MLEENVQEEVESLAAQNKVILFQLTKDIYVIHMDYLKSLRNPYLRS